MSILDTLSKSLIEVYASKLSAQEQQELVACLEVLADDQKYNLFRNTFPKEGEFSKDKYPKHIEFMNAGNKYRERAFIAANRVGKCVSFHTLIDHPDGTKTKAGELYNTKKPFPVLSWDGEKLVESTAIDFIKKPKEELFRVWLSNGQTFECAENHRVLLASGEYSFVSDLLQYSVDLEVSIQELDRIVRVLGGLRLNQTRSDCQCGYCEYSRQYGEQLLLDGDNALGVPQQQVDALLHTFASCNKGVQGNNNTHNLLGVLCLLSIQGGVLPFSALLNACLNQDVLQFFERSSCLFSLWLQSLLAEHLPNTVLEKVLCHNKSSVALLNPLSNEVNRIVAYNSIGVNDIYDFTVEGHHNYLCSGIIHHNTRTGAYETTCHATGDYPDDWEGRRYKHPVLIWVGGDTGTTVRDYVQTELLGPFGEQGTGMIPKDKIIKCTPKRGIPDAYESITVQHVTGGYSTIVFKSYEQGRVTWQGAKVDFIWMDEEPPVEVYGEAIIRLMTTDGSIILTWTPLQGLTPVVETFLNNNQDSDAKYPKYTVKVAWRDVPHMTEEMKDQMLQATPPQLKLARSEGDPSVGAGLIYPLARETYAVDDFKVPSHWMKLYGMDVGWNNTAAIWGAWDRDNDVVYIYSEYKQGEAQPLFHAEAIKARGKWIKGTIDPASRGRSQIDGENLFMLYRKQGLKIVPADNSVETGIYKVWERLSTGKMKVFKSCVMFLSEISSYHRDEKGKIVKRNDHLCDCVRYLCSADSNVWSYPSDEMDNRQKVVDISKYMNACI